MSFGQTDLDSVMLFRKTLSFTLIPNSRYSGVGDSPISEETLSSLADNM